jgi:hypothetical protein
MIKALPVDRAITGRRRQPAATRRWRILVEQQAFRGIIALFGTA